MFPGMIGLLIVVVICVVLVAWFVTAYNGLVRLRNHVQEAWAQIDVQLKRRHDLIPNIVETVKGYAAHEKETLESVIAARGAAVAARGPDAQAAAEAGLTGALGRLMLLAEAYPNLKADANFRQLQEELAATENKIGFARQYYNEQVNRYNTRLQSIPDNIVAGMFNFTAEPFFEIENKTEREAPKVKF
jgi:LemA protein